MGHQEFDQAAIRFKADPSPLHLQELLRYAIGLEPEPRWRNMRAKGALEKSFTRIRALCDRPLDDGEVRRLAGCLGYALKATLASEELGEPSVCYPASGGAIAFTVLEFGWDSRSTVRSQPDFSQAFSTARAYIFAGTPLRTTDKEGKGTRDTRLVEGIALCNLSFFLR